MNSLNFIKNSVIYSLLLLLISSCSSNDDELTLVFPNKVNYETFIIANHLGYFETEKNGIEIKTVNSGINAAEALALGNADVCAMGDGPAVVMMSKQKPVSIISRYAKGMRIHRLISKSGITTPQALKGKKIGIQMGSSTHAAFLGWLNAQGVKAEDIKVVPMQPKNMPEAMKTGQLDAIAGSEPWALNVEKLCKEEVHELANLQSKKNHFPHLLLAANSQLEQADKIKAIIQAIDKSNAFIAQYPDSAAAISANYIGFSKEDARTCMSRLNWHQGWEASDQQSIQTTIKFFQQSNKINEQPELNRFLRILKDD